MTSVFGESNQIIDSMLSVRVALMTNKFNVTNDIGLEVSLTRIKNFFNLNTIEAAVFTCIFCSYFANGERPVNIEIISGDFKINPLLLVQYKETFSSLENKGLLTVESSPDHMSLSRYYRIPDNVVNAVIKKDSHLIISKLRTEKIKGLISPKDIAEKELFYMSGIKNEVKKLGEYLEKDKLSAIQERLEEKGMPKGVCIMLYGESGTGKTETVFQLAKKTGRAVYRVNVGSVVSQWKGGTQNNLSILFNRYAGICMQAKKLGEEIPILLFNEADALFSSRIQNPRSGADYEENHIQSLLLDYIEKQEGILIATTNLAGNFDDAYERRFLFKIKFEKPDMELTKKIWKNKANWLTKQSVERLASNYPLSGAQIENVVRKATMNEVLTGKRSSVKELEGFCQREKLESHRQSKIGFCS